MTSLWIALAMFAAVPEAEAAGPEVATDAFLDAFRAMDEGRLAPFFAADATMFFPDGPFPEGRVEGRDAVMAAFRHFFGRVKEQGRSSLSIVPVARQVQRYGDVAVVTFELQSDDAVGRRTIMMRQDGRDWRIVHFHASRVEKD